MKAKTSKKTKRTFDIRHAVSSIIVCAIILVVPVFSLLEFGHFFRGNDTRTDITLPVMTQRKADMTALPAQLFQEPLISVTFDDGFESIYKTAVPLLQKYGIHSTQYVLPGNTGSSFYVNWKQIGQMQAAGHEIACHTMTHPDLTTLDAAMVNYQLSQCKTELTNRFGVISDFATPYGATNPSVTSAITQYFDSNRNTNGDPSNGVSDVDVNTANNFNRYNIIGVTVSKSTTIKQLQDLVTYAKMNNGWVVLTYHQADEGDPSKFAVDPGTLAQQFAYLSSTNVRIVTVHDALAATRLQNVEY